MTMRHKDHHKHPSRSEFNLCDVRADIPLRVKALRHGEAAVCQRLREMGFCEFAEIRKVSQSGACICQVCGVNVALSKYLAKNIIVETIEAGSGSSGPAHP